MHTIATLNALLPAHLDASSIAIVNAAPASGTHDDLTRALTGLGPYSIVRRELRSRVVGSVPRQPVGPESAPEGRGREA
ncbi:hypothetical protein GXW82_04160 [Streptacidiphilus sp. 4-A2]|nr:hypothetical protein [Streptacidiphilus sp. 4-A2]